MQACFLPHPKPVRGLKEPRLPREGEYLKSQLDSVPARPFSLPPPRTQVAMTADSYATLICAPRPCITAARAQGSVEVGDVNP